MSNPVCFFDIEIGGQPAGTIEMTVRARERRRARASDDASTIGARERETRMIEPGRCIAR